ncbi:MAG TPA: hypothetical protein VML19_18950 [Verrucomicrobiae bacterium]|nr:hypothetical protein [Verrucomicrobiae bacterium]
MTQHHPRLYAAFFAALALCGAAPVQAADACQTIEAAGSKIWSLPVHLYSTQTAAFRKNQPKTSESIYTGGANGAIYVLVNGKWTRSRVTTGELKSAPDEAREKNKQTCHYERDEPVNGEPAAVYSTHAEGEDFKTDITVWISKTRNVPLRSESDMDVGGAMGKSHTSVRYEYTNVQPPPGVK